MPELPEIEIVSRGLNKTIIGKKISSVIISDKNLRLPFPQNFVSDLENQKIISISRRARYLLIEITNNQIMIIHLGMSGSLIYYSKLMSKVRYLKHNHCLIKFSDGSYLIYNDPRRFGLIDLITKDKLMNHKMIKNLGLEPFSSKFTASYLKEKLKNKKINIKTAMMDNSIVVGVGNIYINESLFASKILPLRNSQSLSSKELESLISNIKKILAKAIKLGGSTLRNYINSEGNSGEFQFDLKVYGRNNQKCFNCNNIIKKIVQNGRSSFYCPNCQK